MSFRTAFDKPHTKGGRASSLIRRHDADRALLAALADNPHPTIAGLSRLIGCSEARTSTHLGKLVERGLTASPMCVPGRSWALTGEGLAVAMELSARWSFDDLDCDVLKVIAEVAIEVDGDRRAGWRVQIDRATARRSPGSSADWLVTTPGTSSRSPSLVSLWLASTRPRRSRG